MAAATDVLITLCSSDQKLRPGVDTLTDLPKKRTGASKGVSMSRARILASAAAIAVGAVFLSRRRRLRHW